ncbi:MAG: succinate dehydrogenase assembly factor 2 [Aestuariivirga sp.]
MSANLETIRKRLLWRATHRGIKEMDILVGGYAQQHLQTMTSDELSEFEVLLEIPDQDLLSWATRQEDVPPQFACSMLTAILTYRPEANA